MTKAVALIPARGGSKGIKGKNIALLNGNPLISYTINAALGAECIEQVYVSSDSQQILTVSQHYGAIALERDGALAQDSTPTNPVIEDFIQKINLDEDDIIVLLQPTSPLRTSKHIQSAYQKYIQTPECDGLISVASVDSKYLYCSVISNDFLAPIAEQYANIARRQDLPSLYLPNGAIYIFSVKKFLLKNAIPKQNIVAYIMENTVSLDIDIEDDLIRAEEYLTQQGSELHD